jgi:hypothetical protein
MMLLSAISVVASILLSMVPQMIAVISPARTAPKTIMRQPRKPSRALRA